MKIAKYANNPQEFLSNCPEIYNNLNKYLEDKYKDYNIYSFALEVSMVDGQIEFQSYEEFAANYKDIKHSKIMRFFFCI